MAPSRDGLMDQAEPRWTALATAHPDLGDTIALQRLLLAETVALLARLDEEAGSVPALDPAEAAANLARGVPVLRGARIEVPEALLAPSLDRFCRHLAQGGAGDVARHLVETFEAGRLTRGSLIAASLARRRRAIEAGASQMSLSPALVWLVGELATAPLAYRMQERLFRGPAAAALGPALDAWDRGYCPACGSWPALIELVGGRRLLRCSYCAATWGTRSRRCIYCGEGGAAFSVSAPDPAQPAHQLELCARCRGYTKAVRVDRPTDFPLVAVEDLETLSLDQTAVAQQYERPPLPELEGLDD